MFEESIRIYFDRVRLAAQWNFDVSDVSEAASNNVSALGIRV